MKKSAAFTLIELLVVITIIAILAAIAVPAFSAAQDRALAIKDANNLKQIGIAFTAYLNDHDDSFFASAPPWPQALSPKYLSDWRTLQSPFDRRASTTAAPYNVSYDYNSNLLSTSSKTVSASDVASSSNCIIIAPLLRTGYPNITFGLDDGTATGRLTKSSNSNPTNQTGGTHSKGKRINVLLQDAHVESMLIQDFHSTLPNNDSSTSSRVSDLRWNPISN